MEQLEIPFGCQVSLQSAVNSLYVGLRQQSQAMLATFPHPFTQIGQDSPQNADSTLRLRLVSRDGEIEGSLADGSRVYLVLGRPGKTGENTDEYLTATSKGELKFDKKSMHEEMNKMLLKSACWTVSYASSQKQLISPTKKSITPLDRVVFKSVYGAYLSVKGSSLACLAEPEMAEQRSEWRVVNAGKAQLPEWIFNQPAFCKYMNPECEKDLLIPVETHSLRPHPPQVQEALLVEDLLDLMLGEEGVYIKKKQGKPIFVIQPHHDTPTCNIALAQLTYRILQLPSLYWQVMSFEQRLGLSQGCLAQSLRDGIRGMIAEYNDQVTRLDEMAEEGLTLQLMWVQIQGILRIMRGLSVLASEADKLEGGQLLTCLLQLTNSTSDRYVLNIYQKLQSSLTEVYLQMLSKWIYEGTVQDRHGEFMIEVTVDGDGDHSNFEQRYKLKRNMTPSVLTRQADKILVTGKYINILKSFKGHIVCPLQGELQANFNYHLSQLSFAEPIDHVYDWTNAQLLQLILRDGRLEDVLKSIRGYYFMSFGDCYVQLFSDAAQYLGVPRKQKQTTRRAFSHDRIENCFDPNPQLPFSSQFSLRVDTMTLFEQIHRIKTLESQTFNFDFSEKPYIKKDSRYIDFVTLDFQVGFPLNLILNKKTIGKYQCLFRLLLWLQFMEREVGLVWNELQLSKSFKLNHFKTAYALNNRITFFLRSIFYYVTQEVISRNWNEMMAQIKQAKNFREIIEMHEHFINQCLRQAMITNQNFLQQLMVDIGSVINNYLMAKEHLAIVSNTILDQLNANLTQTSREMSLSDRRGYCRYMRNEVITILDERKFEEFIEKAGTLFGSTTSNFIREVTLNLNHQPQLLTLLQDIDQDFYMGIPREQRY